MNETEIQLALKDNEIQHKLYEQYLENDKKRLDKQEELINGLAALTSKLAEQSIQTNEYMVKHIDKPSFWETKNGGKLLNVLIIIGISVIVAAIGMNIIDMMHMFGN